MALKNPPPFGKTESARMAKAITSSMNLPTWDGLDINLKVSAIAACVKHLVATLEEVGIYNQVIFRSYQEEVRRSNYQKKMIARLRKKLTMKSTKPEA